MISDKARKSQISLILILGVLLVLVAGTIIITSAKKGSSSPVIPKSSELDATAMSFKSYIDDCFYNAAVEGGYKLAGQGGHYPLPADYARKGYYTIVSLYRYSSPDENQVLSRGEIENNYELYIKEKVSTCIADLDNLYPTGVEIQTDELEPDVKIFDEKVVVSSKYSITLTQGETKKVLSGMPSRTLNLRLGLLNDMAARIVNWIIQDKGLIPSGSLDEYIRNHGPEVHAYIGGFDYTSVYVLYDSKSSKDVPAGLSGKFQYVFGADFT